MPEIEAGRDGNGQLELRGVLPPRTVLRGYELKSVLGQGAFGITYRAVDTTLHRDVAIKEYLPSTLALREGRTTVVPRSVEHAEQFAWGRERFLDEARVLARLDRSTAIIRVFDFLEANGTAYMVMALVEGETLGKRLLREQKLTPEAIERLLFPLLDGLEEIHAATFLHRDIKPANIMLDARGQPTLIDFGASRAAMSERSVTMTAIFTPGYAAAEQFIASAKLGPWTDIYGLSATLYHAITGRIPPSAVERILDDEYKPLGELQPMGFSPSLLAGIDAGLAVRAGDRPQSIAEWREIMRPAASAVEGATRVVRKPARSARAASRTGRAGFTLRGPALWGAAAAIVLSLTGAGWLAYRASTPATVSTAALALSADQLEQALTERRKADALAAEKARLEDEARLKAEADSAAKRQADAELEQARQARQKAEDELTQLKADIEARRRADRGPRDQAEAASRRAAEEALQRKAEAEAASLRQTEEEARTKAAAETEAKRLADEALVKAQAERRQADEEARQKAEAETARRKADEETRHKAEATAKEKGEAERRRLEADGLAKAEAEAARRKIDEETRRMAEASAKEKGEAEAAAQKLTAEVAESGLRLELADRQRLQVALTSLGFDTRGNDGVFGPRSRETIAGWQKARRLPTTGFLDAAQHQALLKEAAAAVGKFDEAQKKAEEDKRIAEEARTRVAAARPIPTSAAADGLWRGTYACGVGVTVTHGNAVSPAFALDLEMRVTNGSAFQGGLAGSNLNGNTREFGISVGSDGAVNVSRTVGNSKLALAGRFDGNSIRAGGREYGNNPRECTLALTREPGTAPSASTFDGVYSGDIADTVPRRFVRLNVANGQGSGSITSTGNCTTSFTVTISAAGDLSGEGLLCTFGTKFAVGGRFEGNVLILSGLPNSAASSAPRTRLLRR